MSEVTRLIQALAPLGFSAHGLSAAELAAVGAELDAIAAELAELRQEMNLVTARSWGLAQVEHFIGKKPIAPTLELRRESLIALLRVGACGATVQGINTTLTGCGLLAQARETENPGTVEVFFPDVPGVPDGFLQIQRIIESIIPSHLSIYYYFWKITWDEVEAKFSSWDALEAMGFDFEAFEKYVDKRG